MESVKEIILNELYIPSELYTLDKLYNSGRMELMSLKLDELERLLYFMEESFLWELA